MAAGFQTWHTASLRDADYGRVQFVVKSGRDMEPVGDLLRRLLDGRVNVAFAAGVKCAGGESEGPDQTASAAVALPPPVAAVQLPASWTSVPLELQLPPMRASALLRGDLRTLVSRLSDDLHAVHDDVLCEEREGALRRISHMAPHTELINPRLATPYPGDLTEDELGMRAAMAKIAQCRPHTLRWVANEGTGARTTAALVVTLTGVAHVCRGLHVSVAAARAAGLTEASARDVLATARSHVEAQRDEGNGQ